jgi:hypothetical protein
MGQIKVRPKHTEQCTLWQGNTSQEKYQQMSTTLGPLPNPDEASILVHSQLQSCLPDAIHRVRTDRVSNKKYHIPDGGKREKKVVIAWASRSKWSSTGSGWASERACKSEKNRPQCCYRLRVVRHR